MARPETEQWPYRAGGRTDELTAATAALATSRTASRRRSLRRLLGGLRRSHVFLAIASCAFGAAVSGVAFVGVWRHSASESQRAQASAALAERQTAAARRQVAALRTELAAARASLARAARARASLSRDLSARGAALRRAASERADLKRQLSHAASTLDGLASEAAGVAQQTSVLESDLAALQRSVAGSGGADPGFVATQVDYVLAASREARARAAQLQAHVAATTPGG